MDNQTLVVSNETFYDEEKELYYTYIGTKPPKRELFALIYGKTADQSRMSALLTIVSIHKNTEK